MQLEVDLVVEHVLAQGATEGGLHRVLGHGMHPEPVDVGVAVLAVGTLVHLWGTHPALGLNLQFPLATASAPNPPKPKNVHSTAPPPASSAPASLTCSAFVSSDGFGRFEDRGGSELLGKETRLEAAGESGSSFSAWLDEAGRERERRDARVA